MGVLPTNVPTSPASTESAASPSKTRTGLVDERLNRIAGEQVAEGSRGLALSAELTLPAAQAR
jgi:hypothetical protein